MSVRKLKAFETLVTAADQKVFTLTTVPSVNSKVKLYINGVRISNSAYGYKTNSGGLTDSSTPTLYIGYTSASNGSYLLVVGDRIQMDYYY